MKLYELTESYVKLAEIQEEGGDVVEAIDMIEDAMDADLEVEMD
jgi:hypothetical protein